MSGQHDSNKEVDTIQASVAEYACGLAYAQLPLAGGFRPLSRHEDS